MGSIAFVSYLYTLHQNHNKILQPLNSNSVREFTTQNILKCESRLLQNQNCERWENKEERIDSGWQERLRINVGSPRLRQKTLSYMQYKLA